MHEDGFSERSGDEEPCPNAEESAAVRVIKLNVSGVTFKTTLLTLTTCNSIFKSMFTGDISAPRLEDGSYFIDCDAEMFYHILEYLRNMKIVLKDFSPIALKKLLNVASSFKINSLCKEIALRLQPEYKYDWIDSDCGNDGIRCIPGSNIVFIVAKEAYWDFDAVFDVPPGYKWATTSEFAIEFERSKESIDQAADAEHVYPAWGVEELGWHKYTKHGLKRLFFVFKDTPQTQTYIPSGKNLITTATHKVWKFFHETEEYCEQRGLNLRHCHITDKGIARGFSGIVALQVPIE